jgi:hypothetical protein
VKNQTLRLGPVPLFIADGASLRPLVTEIVLQELGEEHLLGRELQELRQAAIGDDPLWRQTMAALSVGPLEFARFEAERVQAALAWPSLFTAIVTKLSDQHKVGAVTIIFSEMLTKGELASISNVPNLLIKFEEDTP